MILQQVVTYYAAIVATATGAFQIRQWIIDRSKVKVEASIRVSGGPPSGSTLVPWLFVRAVNTGRRPAWVKQVGALIERPTPQLTEITVFGASAEQPVELSPDGGEKEWKVPLPNGVDCLMIERGKNEDGKAYVMLTSRKKYYAKFAVISSERWHQEPIRIVD